MPIGLIMYRRSCMFPGTSGLSSRAGQKVRIQQGKGRSGNEDGPIHDQPDWHFADGRLAPETPKQQYWKNKRLKQEVRDRQLWEEMEKDIKDGNWQQYY